ncbi:MAG: hypothetical protein IPG38_18115 [Chitinophagaceae bacterium]|nr:hypothetical protein [Chitinophagaceae bacterium]
MSWTNFKKSVLLFCILILLTTIGIAQSVNPVTITVSSTEYDNPSLTGLKEYLKSNSKVKGLKSTFNNSVATLNFTYSDAADEFWDEIPTEKKQTFKLISIDSKIIKLQVVKISPTTNVKTDSKNCGCDYYPLCNVDVTKSYNGKVYKGFRKTDESIDYFNCDAGVITRIITKRIPTVAINEYNEYYDTYKNENILITVLKTKHPVGTTWTNPADDDFFTDYYSIAAKNISISHNGQSFSDVIKLRVITKTKKTKEEYTKQSDTYSLTTRSYVYLNTFYDNGEVYKQAQEYYFDRVKGFIKSENIWENIKKEHPNRIEVKSPQQIQIEFENKQKEEAAAEEKDKKNKAAKEELQQKRINDSLKLNFTGNVDASLEGTWRYFNRAIEAYLIYQFNSNGTFKYYSYDMKPINLNKDGNWKVKEDSLLLLYPWPNRTIEIFSLEKIPFRKINNVYNGKPSIIIDHGAGPFEFEIMNNKSPWPNIPAYGNNNTPSVKEIPKIEGTIDTEITGVWISKTKTGVVGSIYTLNADGTGTRKTYSVKGKLLRDEVFEWRMLNGVLKKMRNCGDGLKCFGEDPIEKITSGGKVRQIKFDKWDIHDKQ